MRDSISMDLPVVRISVKPVKQALMGNFTTNFVHLAKTTQQTFYLITNAIQFAPAVFSSAQNPLHQSAPHAVKTAKNAPKVNAWHVKTQLIF